MISVETVGKIRRRHLVKGESISKIARETGLSRNIVKRYLRNAVLEPGYSPRLRQVQPKLGPFVARLEALLKADETRAARERRTAQRLFEALRLEGYAGAYDSVRRFVKRWVKAPARGTTAAVFIPLYFAPGEAYQFDWSHEVVELGGLPQTVKVAHIKLCHSRVFLVIAYPRESQEMLFDAHERAFRFFGGVPRRGIYDNMKTAVDLVYTGRERRFNKRFLQLASHYLVEPTACTPAAGWEKGRVENQVGNVREWLFTPKLRFKTLAEMNVWLERRCREIARQGRHPEQPEATSWQVFEVVERAALMPLTAPFDGFAERECRVNSSALVTYDSNRYSVECGCAGKVAAVCAYAERIVVVAEGRVVAEHAREFGRDRVIYNPWHYLPALARKPGAAAQWRAVPAVGPAGVAGADAGAADQGGGRRPAVRRDPRGGGQPRAGNGGGGLRVGAGSRGREQRLRAQRRQPSAGAAPRGCGGYPGDAQAQGGAAGRPRPLRRAPGQARAGGGDDGARVRDGGFAWNGIRCSRP